MSERGNFRGGGGHRGERGAGSGAGGRGQGGNRGGRGGHATNVAPSEKPKKENILDLTKYMHKQVQVKFNGGREGTVSCSGLSVDGVANMDLVVGTLEGYDQLMNLVLDHVKETLRGRLSVALVDVNFLTVP